MPMILADGAMELCDARHLSRSFLKDHDGATTVKHVAKLGTSQATAYRLPKLFRDGCTVLSLVNRRRGRPTGRRMLDEKRNKIIKAAIKGFYLKRTRPAVSQLIVQVQADCVSAKLKAPHRRTILARINDIDLRKRAQHRGGSILTEATHWTTWLNAEASIAVKSQKPLRDGALKIVARGQMKD